MPLFTPDGLLPEGIHEASWSELEEHLADNAHRQRLLIGLLAGLRALATAGSTRAYIDGSFVTAKAQPGDIDVCYESHQLDFSLLDPVLKDFSNRRAAQKQKYGCEFFEADLKAAPDGILFLDFFQVTRDGKPKGIIAINLSDLPKEVNDDKK